MSWPKISRFSSLQFNGYKLKSDMTVFGECRVLPETLRVAPLGMVSGESLYARSAKLKINHLVAFRDHLLMLNSTGIYLVHKKMLQVFAFGPIENISGLSLVAAGDYLVLTVPQGQVTVLHLFVLHGSELVLACKHPLDQLFSVHSVAAHETSGCRIILHSCVEGSNARSGGVRAVHTLAVFQAEKQPSEANPTFSLTPLARLHSVCRSSNRYANDGDMYAPLATGCLPDCFFVLSYTPFTLVDQPLPETEDELGVSPMLLYSVFNFDGSIRGQTTNREEEDKSAMQTHEEKSMEDEEDENDMTWAAHSMVDNAAVIHTSEDSQPTTPIADSFDLAFSTPTTSPAAAVTTTTTVKTAATAASLSSDTSLITTRYIPYLRFLFRDFDSKNNQYVLGLIDGSDVCVFHVSQNADWEHVCTFGGLGYLAKGKPQKNFVGVSPGPHLIALIADFSKHLWLYWRPTTTSQLQCPQALLDCDERIAGFHLEENCFWVLTETCLYQHKLMTQAENQSC